MTLAKVFVDWGPKTEWLKEQGKGHRWQLYSVYPNKISTIPTNAYMLFFFHGMTETVNTEISGLNDEDAIKKSEELFIEYLFDLDLLPHPGVIWEDDANLTE